MIHEGRSEPWTVTLVDTGEYSVLEEGSRGL